MRALTYTANGYFDNAGEMSVNVCIPKEPSSGIYITQLYNLSKKTANGNINAVFCFFSDGSDDSMEHDGFDYRLNFNIKSLKPYDEASNFDTNANETLFLFFHNRESEIEDLEKYFAKLEKTYEKVKEDGNHSEDAIINSMNKPTNSPRKIGLSLINKFA